MPSINRFYIEKHLSRSGSLVTLLLTNGEIWLTRRKKRRRDSGRQKLKRHSVLFIPIKRLNK